MKLFLKCGHEIDNADPKGLCELKDVPFGGQFNLGTPDYDNKVKYAGTWFYPCWTCEPTQFSVVDRLGDSNADHERDAAKLAKG